jgi:four helix bundle protein
MDSYRELKVWQKSMDIAERIFCLTQDFPKQQQYGLASQIQRAAVSIPANVAEGHGRSTTREYLRFLSIARGSLAELETELLLAKRIGFVDPLETAAVLEELDEISRMLRGLQNAIKRKLD